MASPAAGALPGLGPVFAGRVVLGVTLTAGGRARLPRPPGRRGGPEPGRGPGRGRARRASVGTALTAFIPTAESAQPLLAFSYFPVMLLSGALGALGTPGCLAGLLASVRLLRWAPQPPGGGRRSARPAERA